MSHIHQTDPIGAMFSSAYATELVVAKTNSGKTIKNRPYKEIRLFISEQSKMVEDVSRLLNEVLADLPVACTNIDAVITNVARSLAVLVAEFQTEFNRNVFPSRDKWADIALANLGLELKLQFDPDVCKIVDQILDPYRPKEVSYLEINPGIKI